MALLLRAIAATEPGSEGPAVIMRRTPGASKEAEAGCGGERRESSQSSVPLPPGIKGRAPRAGLGGSGRVAPGTSSRRRSDARCSCP